MTPPLDAMVALTVTRSRLEVLADLDEAIGRKARAAEMARIIANGSSGGDKRRSYADDARAIEADMERLREQRKRL